MGLSQVMKRTNESENNAILIIGIRAIVIFKAVRRVPNAIHMISWHDPSYSQRYFASGADFKLIPDEI